MAVGDVKSAWGTTKQALTITLASLPSSTSYVGRQSDIVDNTAAGTKFLDELIFAKIKTSASALANDKTVYLYAIGTVNTTDPIYTENAGVSDAAHTLTNPPNARLIGSVNCPSTSTTYYAGPFSLAAAFGGVMPDHWGVTVVNVTGQDLDSTGSNHAIWYQGVFANVAAS